MGGSSKSGSKQTVGYKYYIGVHMALCHGPIDSIEKIEVAERQIHPRGGNNTGSVVDGSQRITINQGNIFGGEAKEGGISGSLDILYGDHTERNDYLQDRLGADVPAFKGVCSAVLRRMYIAANNPYIKKWAFWVKRIPRSFYPEKAEINGFQANPAHIIYEVLTNRTWGAGLSPSFIDEASFREAADTLHEEEFGLGIRWNQQDSIYNFVQIIVDHIGGVVDFDPFEGQFRLKLVRGDYDFATLPVYGGDDIMEINSLDKPSWGETVNEIIVNYVDTEGEDSSVRVRDLANIQQQNAIVYTSTNYSGIQTKALAIRVAERDLKAQSIPLWRVRFTAKRTTMNLRPGDVFVLNMPDYEISNLAMRVLEVTLPDQTSTNIEVQAVQDVYAMNPSDYSFQEDLWEDVTQQDIPPVTEVYNTEAPLWEIAIAQGDDAALALDPNAGYLITYAERPRQDIALYNLHTNAGSGYVDRGATAFGLVATLTEDVGPLSTTFSVTYDELDFPDLDAEDKPYVYIDGEAMELVSWTDSTFTVNRGILDTVPQPHGTGAKIYFGSFFGTDEIEYFSNETVNVKHQPVSTYDVLDLEDATNFNYTFGARVIRPFPPGRVSLNGTYLSEEYIGDSVDLSWVHRNRTRTGSLISFTDAGDTPEDNQQYTLRIYGESGQLLRTQSGIEGTAYSYPVTSEISDNNKSRPEDSLRIELETTRDGYTSWQTHNFTSEAYGYGMKYGDRYGE